jgi:hypothetical protein
MQVYLTEEDYETAKANGISRANAYARFYAYGWSVERTISTPVKSRKKALWPRFKAIAEQNGISQSRFYQRVSKGMKPKEAASTPLQQGGWRGTRVITDELIALAASNGISEKTLRHRYYAYHWGLERAATQSIAENRNWRKKNETTSFRHFGQLQRR